MLKVRRTVAWDFVPGADRATTVVRRYQALQSVQDVVFLLSPGRQRGRNSAHAHRGHELGCEGVQRRPATPSACHQRIGALGTVCRERRVRPLALSWWASH